MSLIGGGGGSGGGDRDVVTIDWVMLCRRFSTDGNDLPYIEGIFSGFTVPEVPVYGTGTLVIRLRGEPGKECKLLVQLLGSTGDLSMLGIPTAATVILGEAGYKDLSSEVRLLFPEAGQYQLRVSAEQEVRVLPLTVEVSGPPAVH